MPRLVELSTFLGAFVILGTVWCLTRPRLRRLGIVVGCVGITAGALSALVYTLAGMRRGIDIDAIPHEPAAQWFVAVFGWAGLLAAAAAAAVPALRAKVDGPPLQPDSSKSAESG